MASAAFFIPWLIVHRKNDENENLIFSAAFALFGLRLIASYLNKSFEYTLKGFTIKNIFGVKRQYEYNQLQAVPHIGLPPLILKNQQLKLKVQVLTSVRLLYSLILRFTAFNFCQEL